MVVVEVERGNKICEPISDEVPHKHKQSPFMREFFEHILSRLPTQHRKTPVGSINIVFCNIHNLLQLQIDFVVAESCLWYGKIFFSLIHASRVFVTDLFTFREISSPRPYTHILSYFPSIALFILFRHNKTVCSSLLILYGDKKNIFAFLEGSVNGVG